MVGKMRDRHIFKERRSPTLFLTHQLATVSFFCNARMSTWYHHDYPQSNPEDFSTLEVAPQPTRFDGSFKEMQSPTGLKPVHLERGNLAAR